MSLFLTFIALGKITFNIYFYVVVTYGGRHIPISTYSQGSIWFFHPYFRGFVHFLQIYRSVLGPKEIESVRNKSIRLLELMNSTWKLILKKQNTIFAPIHILLLCRIDVLERSMRLNDGLGWVSDRRWRSRRDRIFDRGTCAGWSHLISLFQLLLKSEIVIE